MNRITKVSFFKQMIFLQIDEIHTNVSEALEFSVMRCTSAAYLDVRAI